LFILVFSIHIGPTSFILPIHIHLLDQQSRQTPPAQSTNNPNRNNNNNNNNKNKNNKGIVLPEHATKKAYVSGCVVPPIPSISTRFTPGCFYPRRRRRQFSYIGGWMRRKKRNLLCLTGIRQRILVRLARSLVGKRTTLY
jgi:hypothetical protein